MLEFGDIITLENKEKYVVASTCAYNNNFFVYIVNQKDKYDCILGIVEGDDFKEIKDANLFVEVMPLLLDNIDLDILGNGDDKNG